MANSASVILQNLATLGFTNVSVTSIEGIIAISIGQFDDNLLAEIANSESTINNIQQSQWGYGSPNYYVQQALQFQLGDNLIVNTAINPVTGQIYGNLIYAVIDTTKQIIAQAAFQKSLQGASFLKVATQAISGTGLAPLTSDQLVAFKSYMLNFEIVDIPLNIISIPGIILNFVSTVTYFSSFDLPTLQSNVVAAFNTFLRGFQFNGIFYATDLEQYIQNNVQGIRSFFINDTELDGIAFLDYINLSSGYFDYDPSVLTSLTYNPVSS